MFYNNNNMDSFLDLYQKGESQDIPSICFALGHINNVNQSLVEADIDQNEFEILSLEMKKIENRIKGIMFSRELISIEALHDCYIFNQSIQTLILLNPKTEKKDQTLNNIYKLAMDFERTLNESLGCILLFDCYWFLERHPLVCFDFFQNIIKNFEQKYSEGTAKNPQGVSLYCQNYIEPSVTLLTDRNLFQNAVGYLFDNVLKGLNDVAISVDIQCEKEGSEFVFIIAFQFLFQNKAQIEKYQQIKDMKILLDDKNSEFVNKESEHFDFHLVEILLNSLGGKINIITHDTYLSLFELRIS
jgi:hypothetical protein